MIFFSLVFLLNHSKRSMIFFCWYVYASFVVGRFIIDNGNYIFMNFQVILRDVRFRVS